MFLGDIRIYKGIIDMNLGPRDSQIDQQFYIVCLSLLYS